MQKHQDWMENRSYQQHLQCLQKIKARKNHSANGRKTVKKFQHSKFTPFQLDQKQNRISNLYFNRENTTEELNPNFGIHLVPQTQRINQNNQNYEHRNQLKVNLQQQNLTKNSLTYRNPFSISQNLFHKSKKNHILQKTDSKECTIMTLKQQQLLWNNFLLGKRILQTSPVISKRKLDMDYQKHKELLRSRTVKKHTETSNFRLRKLHEHNGKIQKISDDHRIENNLHKRYMLTLAIQSIQIFKFKISSFENILVSMKLGNASQTSTPLQQKPIKTKQVSQCIPSSVLTSYNFFFTMKKKYFQENVPIIIEIKNVKSLNVISIGTFSFQFDQNRNIMMKQANLYNFGKHIGTITFNAHFGKKDQFLSHL